ncbi:MAG: sugar ABC transporter substrate-binding protein [Gammaproteobacteria bacterium]|nr:MAG: sugar ABC transporter substrate-binding protein [Gammaproteobacteria bacterium]
MSGCSGGLTNAPKNITSKKALQYHIGPGDQLEIFVWRNNELSVEVPVRPDGRISTPLVEDIQAAGKTPSQLARSMEKVLSKYIRSPVVTVIVKSFAGEYGQLVRVIGEAGAPKSIPYRSGMTLLDVMIAVGGLTDSAAGNRAAIIRRAGKNESQFSLRLDDLIRDGDISANVQVAPGDTIIIPESWL